MNGMFWNCSSLKEIDVSNFDTSRVTDMTSMFEGCSSLEYIDVTGFDTSSTKYNSDVFRNCTALAPSICIVKGNSITLDGNIGVNVYLQPCEDLSKAVISGPCGEREFIDFSGIIQDSGYYKFSYPINAPQGNEPITLIAYDKDGKRLIVCNDNYGLCDHSQIKSSVYDYINEIKKSKLYSDPTLAAFVDGLENFCKAAENYFNGTKNAIAGIDNVNADSVKDYAPEFGKDIKISLVLNPATALRIYTDADKVEYSDSVIALKTGKYGKYYEITNIPAQKLGSEYRLIIDDTEYKFIPLSYVYRVLNNESASDELIDMAKATYVYAKTAEAYIGK